MALALVVVALLISLIHLHRRDYSALSDHMAGRSRGQLTVMKPCPICGTLLEPGERVHTVVFSGEPPGRRRSDRERPQDALVHMFGCPYCYPANPRVERHCPVCKRTLPDDGFVVARMFTKNQRKHVHVLGCTECRSGSVTQRDRQSG